MKICLYPPALLTLGLIGLVMIFSGCASAPPEIQAPSSAPLLGTRAADQRIPIRGFTIESVDKEKEFKADGVGLGGTTDHMVVFAKKAREFVAQDLRDYVESRFVVDPSATVTLNVKLDYASCRVAMHHSGATWIPIVGAVANYMDMKKDLPWAFAAETTVRVEASKQAPVMVKTYAASCQLTASRLESDEAMRAFVKQTYLHLLDGVRKKLFERLDVQLLSLWSDRQFPQPSSLSAASREASLAGEIERLDVALNQRLISEKEHEKNVRALKTP